MSEEITMPHSPRAEQALLGILLTDNLAIEHIPANFKPEHMFDPLHAKLCAAILDAVQSGGSADPIVLRERFGQDQSFIDVGDFGYLADLVDHAPSVGQTNDFCQVITDFAYRRWMIERFQKGIEQALNDRETPALDQIDAFERDIYEVTAEREQSGPRDLGDVLGAAIQMAADAYDTDGELAGLSTGLADLDKKLGGLPDANLIIVAARPSMGKTSLGLGIGLHNAITWQQALVDGVMKTVKGGVVGFFSAEMSCEELGIRMLAERSGISQTRIKRGQMTADEFGRMRDCAMEILDAPLYIDDTGGISLEMIATRARRLKRTVGLDLLIVDYLQIINMASDRYMSPQERVTNVTKGLKALAKELGIPIIALAQLTRKVEDRTDNKPQLNDLKDSGSIEQDADSVLFLYREAYYLERSPPKEGTAEHMKWEEQLEKAQNEADIIIGKQRHGPIGSVKVLFDGELTKFSDTIKDEEFQPRNAA